MNVPAPVKFSVCDSPPPFSQADALVAVRVGRSVAPSAALAGHYRYAGVTEAGRDQGCLLSRGQVIVIGVVAIADVRRLEAGFWNCDAEAEPDELEGALGNRGCAAVAVPPVRVKSPVPLLFSPPVPVSWEAMVAL